MLDLSCRMKDGQYYIVTDRWQKFTDVPVTLETMEELGKHCDEFLIHAVDVEGKASGIEAGLAELLSRYESAPSPTPGAWEAWRISGCWNNAEKGRLDVTVGSALDIFGGTIPFDVLKRM